MFIVYNCPKCKNELFAFSVSSLDRQIDKNKGFIFDSISHEGEYGDDGGGVAYLYGHCSSCNEPTSILMKGGAHSRNHLWINNESMYDYIRNRINLKKDKLMACWNGVKVIGKDVSYDSFQELTEPHMKQKEKDLGVYLYVTLVDGTDLFLEDSYSNYQCLIRKARSHYEYEFDIEKMKPCPKLDKNYTTVFEDSFVVNGLQMNDIQLMIDIDPYNSSQAELFYFTANKSKMSFTEFESKINEFIGTIVIL